MCNPIIDRLPHALLRLNRTDGKRLRLHRVGYDLFENQNFHSLLYIMKQAVCWDSKS